MTTEPSSKQRHFLSTERALSCRYLFLFLSPVYMQVSVLKVSFVNSSSWLRYVCCLLAYKFLYSDLLHLFSGAGSRDRRFTAPWGQMSTTSSSGYAQCMVPAAGKLASIVEGHRYLCVLFDFTYFVFDITFLFPWTEFIFDNCYS